MNLTYNKLVYELWELLRKRITDDDSIDKRQIGEWMAQQRAFWITRELNNGRLDNAYFQTIPKLELENMNTIEDTSVACSNYIKATKLIIPKILESKTGYLIKRIGPYDIFAQKYTVIDENQLTTTNNGRFNRDAIYAALKDSKVLIVSTPTNVAYGALKYVSLTSVFEDPVALENFVDENGNTLFNKETTRYPISRRLYVYMKEAIVKYEIPLLKTATEDPINNALNDE